MACPQVCRRSSIRGAPPRSTQEASTNRLSEHALIELWKRDEQAQIVGGDFSYLDDRMVQGSPPWSYLDRARVLLGRAASLLDMDTGGGERLLELKDDWPPKVVVTEAYPPNNRLVHERLAPLGVAIFDVNLTVTGPMPFATGEFDVVLNRHAAFNPAEVARMLGQGGTFLTQQVHGRSTEDLIEAFDSKPQWPFATPEFYVPQLEAAGLTIDRVEQCSSRVKFADVGAIVYYLGAAPWLVPDFAVDSHLHHLRALQARLEQGEELAFVAKSYLIEASKGATHEDH